MDERVCINKYWLNFAKMEINLLRNTQISVKTNLCVFGNL
jgi:hypothetical protein